MILTKELLIHEYIKNKKSIRMIAKEYNTYSTKILRLLRKYEIPLRDKSQAQAIALKTGRHPHPTEGFAHTDETKKKMSESRKKLYERRNTRD